ncbi:CAP-associated domain-containing protein [Lysinibacillus sp. FSL K6-0232]|uniref:CAP domain-containing protein n=1 Tax=unclassified Lysinibacillus TaxID=2636778 RepID=UPI0030FA442C
MLKKWFAIFAIVLLIFPVLTPITHASASGDTAVAAIKKSVIQKKPYRTFASEYDMEWEMASKNYRQFYLVGRKNNKIVGGYDTRKGQSLFGIKIGESSTTVTKKYGTPVDAILKGMTKYTKSYKDAYGQTTHGTYLIDGKYVTFFYDVHAKNTVRSILWVTKEIELSKNGFYAQASQARQKSFEELTVHLMNQARVSEGIAALSYASQYNQIGRLHSLDMVTNQYFDHTNLKGQEPWDRMKAGGIEYSYAGENIAYGQYSAIYAHEALMNSLGHRQNILQAKFTHAFVGVQFSNKNIPYYTIGFYTPR